MKKSKIIASALLASTILVGSGYAWWTDALTIRNTVQTGEMKVEFVNAKDCAKDVYPGAKNLEDYGKYIDATINQDSKVVNFKVENLYPGTGVLYRAAAENKGTIPVVIDNVEIIWGENCSKELKEKLVVVGGYEHFNSNGIYKKGSSFPTLRDQILRDKRYLGDLQYNLNKMLEGVRLEPGEYITFDIPEEDKAAMKELLEKDGIMGYNPAEDNCIIMGLPGKVGNELEKQNADFSIKINFKQHNQK